MQPGQIWTRYVRYIGAGAVAAAGIITLIRSIPTMIESFRIGAQQMRERVSAGDSAKVARTESDLPLKVTGIGALIVGAFLVIFPQAYGVLPGMFQRVVATFCVILFAFFFVTVASRIVGLVGVTSNPTSGMTIASLLGTSAVFLMLGWTDDMGKMGALTVGAVVAIAASISGDTSQDLKTGFLLGATPRRQQIGEIIGVMTSAVFVCLAVMALDKAYGFGTAELAAPQATLMKVVIEGVLQSSLPWGLVAIGASIAIVAELLRVPSLPFAVGVYLPVATMVPVFLGGLLRLFVEKRAANDDEAAERRESGVLLGSGFVGGEGLLGVVIAVVVIVLGHSPEGIGYAWAGHFAEIIAVIAFAGLAAVMGFIATRKHAEN